MMTAYQTQALAVINGIKADTLRIAVATETSMRTLQSVVGPLGVRAGAMAINVNA
jgi:hypothetical protein